MKRTKLQHYARQYGDGKLTMARAAREAGVSHWEMMEHLRQHKVAVQYDLEALREDIRALEARRGVGQRPARMIAEERPQAY